MEEKKKICRNCGKEVGEMEQLCSDCKKAERNDGASASGFMVLKNKMAGLLKKYQILPSDIIAAVGSLIVLLGVYIFNFFDVTLPFVGQIKSSLAGSIKMLKETLGIGASLLGDSSSSGDVSSFLTQLQLFIIAMTVFPLLVCAGALIHNKILKVVGVISAVLSGLLYMVFSIKIQEGLTSSGISKDIIRSIFGPAGMIIILGLLVMVGGSCYSLYQFFRKNEENNTFTFSGVSKKQKLILSGAVGALILFSITILMLSHMQKSVMKDVNVEFSGYDHQGSANITGEYETDIEKIVSKKPQLDPSDISVELDKYSGLSNGDKVQVTVSSLVKDSPIKSESKTFTVSGLKKSTTYTLESLLKEKNIAFTGFNHYGHLQYDSEIFSTTDEQNLSNGDKITLELSEEYIAQESMNGKILEGEKSKIIEVKDLEDKANISNIDELLAQTDAVARDKNKSNSWSTYTVTRQESYFIGENLNRSWGNEDADTLGEFSVVTLYKVDEKAKYGEDTSKYKIYGYSGLKLNDNKVDVSSLTSEDKYSDYQSFNNVQEALDALKSNYPSLVKIE